MQDSGTNNGSNNRLVQLIAVWMLLVIYPWFEFFYKERGFMPQSLLEGLAIAGITWIIFCALGLVFAKEAARFWTVWIIVVYFFWSFYIVCFNIAPFFSLSVEWLSTTYHTPMPALKGLILFLLITHMTWPLIVIMYLTNPSVKAMFHPLLATEQ